MDYQFSAATAGRYDLGINAWDIYGNGYTTNYEFEVYVDGSPKGVFTVPRNVSDYSQGFLANIDLTAGNHTIGFKWLNVYFDGSYYYDAVDVSAPFIRGPLGATVSEMEGSFRLSRDENNTMRAYYMRDDTWQTMGYWTEGWTEDAKVKLEVSGKSDSQTTIRFDNLTSQIGEETVYNFNRQEQPGETIAEDIDNNGIVDLNDFTSLISQNTQTGSQKTETSDCFGYYCFSTALTSAYLVYATENPHVGYTFPAVLEGDYTLSIAVKNGSQPYNPIAGDGVYTIEVVADDIGNQVLGTIQIPESDIYKTGSAKIHFNESMANRKIFLRFVGPYDSEQIYIEKVQLLPQLISIFGAEMTIPQNIFDLNSDNVLDDADYAIFSKSYFRNPATPISC